MTNFKNIENLENWLKATCKVYYSGNLNAYLDELTEAYGANGSTNYELSKHETKSENPECYSYDVEHDGEDTTYIF